MIVLLYLLGAVSASHVDVASLNFDNFFVDISQNVIDINPQTWRDILTIGVIGPLNFGSSDNPISSSIQCVFDGKVCMWAENLNSLTTTPLFFQPVLTNGVLNYMWKLFSIDNGFAFNAYAIKKSQALVFEEIPWLSKTTMIGPFKPIVTLHEPTDLIFCIHKGWNISDGFVALYGNSIIPDADIILNSPFSELCFPSNSLQHVGFSPATNTGPLNSYPNLANGGWYHSTKSNIYVTGPPGAEGRSIPVRLNMPTTDEWYDNDLQTCDSIPTISTNTSSMVKFNPTVGFSELTRDASNELIISLTTSETSASLAYQLAPFYVGTVGGNQCELSSSLASVLEFSCPVLEYVTAVAEGDLAILINGSVAFVWSICEVQLRIIDRRDFVLEEFYVTSLLKNTDTLISTTIDERQMFVLPYTYETTNYFGAIFSTITPGSSLIYDGDIATCVSGGLFLLFLDFSTEVFYGNFDSDEIIVSFALKNQELSESCSLLIGAENSTAQVLDDLWKLGLDEDMTPLGVAASSTLFQVYWYDSILDLKVRCERSDVILDNMQNELFVYCPTQPTNQSQLVVGARNSIFNCFHLCELQIFPVEPPFSCDVSSGDVDGDGEIDFLVDGCQTAVLGPDFKRSISFFDLTNIDNYRKRQQDAQVEAGEWRCLCKVAELSIELPGQEILTTRQSSSTAPYELVWVSVSSEIPTVSRIFTFGNDESGMIPRQVSSEILLSEDLKQQAYIILDMTVIVANPTLGTRLGETRQKLFVLDFSQPTTQVSEIVSKYNNCGLVSLINLVGSDVQDLVTLSLDNANLPEPCVPGIRVFENTLVADLQNIISSTDGLRENLCDAFECGENAQCILQPIPRCVCVDGFVGIAPNNCVLWDEDIYNINSYSFSFETKTFDWIGAEVPAEYGGGGKSILGSLSSQYLCDTETLSFSGSSLLACEFDRSCEMPTTIYQSILPTEWFAFLSTEYTTTPATSLQCEVLIGIRGETPTLPVELKYSFSDSSCKYSLLENSYSSSPSSSPFSSSALPSATEAFFLKDIDSTVFNACELWKLLDSSSSVLSSQQKNQTNFDISTNGLNLTLWYEYNTEQLINAVSLIVPSSYRVVSQDSNTLGEYAVDIDIFSHQASDGTRRSCTMDNFYDTEMDGNFGFTLLSYTCDIYSSHLIEAVLVANPSVWGTSNPLVPLDVYMRALSYNTLFNNLHDRVGSLEGTSEISRIESNVEFEVSLVQEACVQTILEFGYALDCTYPYRRVHTTNPFSEWCELEPIIIPDVIYDPPTSWLLQTDTIFTRLLCLNISNVTTRCTNINSAGPGNATSMSPEPLVDCNLSTIAFEAFVEANDGESFLSACLSSFNCQSEGWKWSTRVLGCVPPPALWLRLQCTQVDPDPFHVFCKNLYEPTRAGPVPWVHCELPASNLLQDTTDILDICATQMMPGLHCAPGWIWSSSPESKCIPNALIASTVGFTCAREGSYTCVEDELIANNWNCWYDLQPTSGGCSGVPLSSYLTQVYLRTLAAEIKFINDGIPIRASELLYNVSSMQDPMGSILTNPNITYLSLEDASYAANLYDVSVDSEDIVNPAVLLLRIQELLCQKIYDGCTDLLCTNEDFGSVFCQAGVEYNYNPPTSCPTQGVASSAAFDFSSQCVYLRGDVQPNLVLPGDSEILAHHSIHCVRRWWEEDGCYFDCYSKKPWLTMYSPRVPGVELFDSNGDVQSGLCGFVFDRAADDGLFVCRQPFPDGPLTSGDFSPFYDRLTGGQNDDCEFEANLNGGDNYASGQDEFDDFENWWGCQDEVLLAGEVATSLPDSSSFLNSPAIPSLDFGPCLGFVHDSASMEGLNVVCVENTTFLPAWRTGEDETVPSIRVLRCVGQSSSPNANPQVIPELDCTLVVPITTNQPEQRPLCAWIIEFCVMDRDLQYSRQQGVLATVPLQTDNLAYCSLGASDRFLPRASCPAIQTTTTSIITTTTTTSTSSTQGLISCDAALCLSIDANVSLSEIGPFTMAPWNSNTVAYPSLGASLQRQQCRYNGWMGADFMSQTAFVCGSGVATVEITCNLLHGHSIYKCTGQNEIVEINCTYRSLDAPSNCQDLWQSCVETIDFIETSPNSTSESTCVFQNGVRCLQVGKEANLYDPFCTSNNPMFVSEWTSLIVIEEENMNNNNGVVEPFYIDFSCGRLDIRCYKYSECSKTVLCESFCAIQTFGDICYAQDLPKLINPAKGLHDTSTQNVQIPEACPIHVEILENPLSRCTNILSVCSLECAVEDQDGLSVVDSVESACSSTPEAFDQFFCGNEEPIRCVSLPIDLTGVEDPRLEELGVPIEQRSFAFSDSQIDSSRMYFCRTLRTDISRVLKEIPPEPISFALGCLVPVEKFLAKVGDEALCAALGRQCLERNGDITCSDSRRRHPIEAPFCTLPQLSAARGDEIPQNCDCGNTWTEIHEVIPEHIYNTTCSSIGLIEMSAIFNLLSEYFISFGSETIALEGHSKRGSNPFIATLDFESSLLKTLFGTFFADSEIALIQEGFSERYDAFSSSFVPLGSSTFSSPIPTNVDISEKWNKWCFFPEMIERLSSLLNISFAQEFPINLISDVTNTANDIDDEVAFSEALDLSYVPKWLQPACSMSVASGIALCTIYCPRGTTPSGGKACAYTQIHAQTGTDTCHLWEEYNPDNIELFTSQEQNLLPIPSVRESHIISNFGTTIMKTNRSLVPINATNTSTSPSQTTTSPSQTTTTTTTATESLLNIELSTSLQLTEYSGSQWVSEVDIYFVPSETWLLDFEDALAELGKRENGNVTFVGWKKNRCSLGKIRSVTWIPDIQDLSVFTAQAKIKCPVLSLDTNLALVQNFTTNTTTNQSLSTNTTTQGIYTSSQLSWKLRALCPGGTWIGGSPKVSISFDLMLDIKTINNTNPTANTSNITNGGNKLPSVLTRMGNHMRVGVYNKPLTKEESDKELEWLLFPNVENVRPTVCPTEGISLSEFGSYPLSSVSTAKHACYESSTCTGMHRYKNLGFNFVHVNVNQPVEVLRRYDPQRNHDLDTKRAYYLHPHVQDSGASTSEKTKILTDAQEADKSTYFDLDRRLNQGCGQWGFDWTAQLRASAKNPSNDPIYRFRARLRNTLLDNHIRFNNQVLLPALNQTLLPPAYSYDPGRLENDDASTRPFVSQGVADVEVYFSELLHKIVNADNITSLYLRSLQNGDVLRFLQDTVEGGLSNVQSFTSQTQGINTTTTTTTTENLLLDPIYRRVRVRDENIRSYLLNRYMNSVDDVRIEFSVTNNDDILSFLSKEPEAISTYCYQATNTDLNFPCRQFLRVDNLANTTKDAILFSEEAQNMLHASENSRRLPLFSKVKDNSIDSFMGLEIGLSGSKCELRVRSGFSSLTIDSTEGPAWQAGTMSFVNLVNRAFSDGGQVPPSSISSSRDSPDQQPVWGEAQGSPLPPSSETCFTSDKLHDTDQGLELVFDTWIDWYAYMTWIHFFTFEKFQRGARKGWHVDFNKTRDVFEETGDYCGTLNYPLYRGFGAKTQCTERLCPSPAKPASEWVSKLRPVSSIFQGVTGEYPELSLEDAANSVLDTPCGFDHGKCLADVGLCSCNLAFKANTQSVDEEITYMDAAGNVRIPFPMKYDACDLDNRGSCTNPAVDVPELCGAHGECVSAFNGNTRFLTCRCGSFPGISGPGSTPCNDAAYIEGVSQCLLLSPEIEFIENLYTTSTSGYPEKCAVPPQVCRTRKTITTSDYTRASRLRYDRLEDYGCEEPRIYDNSDNRGVTTVTSVSLTNAFRVYGVCRIIDENSNSFTSIALKGYCDCDELGEGRFGHVCERVTVANKCFSPDDITSTTSICAWNPYLMQVDVLPPDYEDRYYMNGVTLLPCESRACSGHGKCMDGTGTRGLDYDPWENTTLPPIANFNPFYMYASDQWSGPNSPEQYTDYVTNIQAELIENARMKGLLLNNQRCECDLGWAGDFCEEGICNPQCIIQRGESCLPENPENEANSPYTCFCHVTSDGTCLKLRDHETECECPESQRLVVCEQKIQESSTNEGEYECACIQPNSFPTKDGTCTSFVCNNTNQPQTTTIAPPNSETSQNIADPAITKQPIFLWSRALVVQVGTQQVFVCETPTCDLFPTPSSLWTAALCSCNPEVCQCLDRIQTSTYNPSIVIDPQVQPTGSFNIGNYSLVSGVSLNQEFTQEIGIAIANNILTLTNNYNLSFVALTYQGSSFYYAFRDGC